MSKITHGYRLPSKFIIHTGAHNFRICDRCGSLTALFVPVGPVYSRSNKEECEALLRSCYQTTLEVAVANNVETLVRTRCFRGV